MRMRLVSFMQHAHHRRQGRRSVSVPEHTRGGSSTSSSDDDASADDGDYEERSAGTPTRRPRSATSSRAISPAPGKQTPRTSELSASPSSSRASKHDDSDESAGELSEQRRRTEQRTVSLGLQPWRTTGHAQYKQENRRQEETGTVCTLQHQQGATILQVGPSNRSPSGTGQADGSAPMRSTVRRACAADHPR